MHKEQASSAEGMVTDVFDHSIMNGAYIVIGVISLQRKKGPTLLLFYVCAAFLH